MDYRYSHTNKGSSYDTILENDLFDHFMAEQEKKILLNVIQTIFNNKINHYLDFACGTGRITRLLENVAKESYGVDISESMLEQARKKCHRTKFVVGDITHGTFFEKNFNLITAFRFFGNAQDELRLSVLKSLNNVLQPDGYLILNNHRNPCAILHSVEKLAGNKEKLDLNYFKLKKLLKYSGFKIICVYGIGFWILSSKFNKYLSNHIAGKIEYISRLGILGPFCPDMVVVAQKEHTH